MIFHEFPEKGLKVKHKACWTLFSTFLNFRDGYKTKTFWSDRS